MQSFHLGYKDFAFDQSVEQSHAMAGQAPFYSVFSTLVLSVSVLSVLVLRVSYCVKCAEV